MAGRDRAWAKVEAFIREQGFACDDERVPEASRKYRKGVDGLQIVVEPAFTDSGRGRLRFTYVALTLYEDERRLTGFPWYPGEQLSRAMDEALRRQMERARSELHLAEERLAAATRDNRTCRGLADWVQRLIYSTTGDQDR